MIKTGIVISIMNKKAGIMTSGGEFVYIKINKLFPNTDKISIGEIHAGELYKKNLFIYKYAIAVASLMFIFLSSGYAHFYYTPVTTVVFSNPSVTLVANRWNKIISCKSLNTDGSLILNNVKLKNKSIDTGLEILVKEAQTENFINDKKIINLDFKSNKNSSIDITKFKNIIDTSKLNIKISASSLNNKTIYITVNNKRIPTSNLDSDNHNQDDIKNQPIIKNNLIQKPSININNNIIEDKSSKTKVENIHKSNPFIYKDNKDNKDNKPKTEAKTEIKDKNNNEDNINSEDKTNNDKSDGTFENKNLNNNENSSANKNSDVSNENKNNTQYHENIEDSNEEGEFENPFDKFFKNFDD